MPAAFAIPSKNLGELLYCGDGRTELGERRFFFRGVGKLTQRFLPTGVVEARFLVGASPHIHLCADQERESARAKTRAEPRSSSGVSLRGVPFPLSGEEPREYVERRKHETTSVDARP